MALYTSLILIDFILTLELHYILHRIDRVVMYCFIKYTELNEKQKEECNTFQSPNNYAAKSLKSVTSKTSVHENKTMMVNPDCYVQILVDYISSVINFDKNSNFDLCNESGQLLQIKTMKPWQYGTTFMESQKIYFVVLCEQDSNGQYRSIEPIVNKNSKDYCDLMMKLKRNIPSMRRFSGEKRSRRRSADEVISRTSSNRTTPRTSVQKDFDMLIKKKSSTKSVVSTDKIQLQQKQSASTIEIKLSDTNITDIQKL